MAEMQQQEEQASKAAGTAPVSAKEAAKTILFMLFLCVINLLIFFDRGAIASVLPKVKDHFNLTSTEEGAIASAFMVGYMVFSVIFAELASKIAVKYIICFGLLMWSMAAILLGLTYVFTTDIWGYYLLVACRTIVGIGEASFLPTTPSLIDDAAPKKYRTLALTIYFAGLPVGIAIGYGISGFLASYVTWGLPFWLEGAAMIVLALACLVIIPTKPKQADDKLLANDSLATDTPSDSDTESVTDEAAANESKQIIQQKAKSKMSVIMAIKTLVTNKVYVLTVMGSTAYTFVLGALSFWAPSFIRESLQLSVGMSSLGFSIVSLITGILGTAVGGILLDRVGGGTGRRGTANALGLSFLFMLLSFPFGLAAILVRHVAACFLLLGVAELFLFAITSTINSVLLSCVSKDLRTYSMGFYIFLIHLCGDFPSPTLFGFVADLLESLSITMLLLWIVLIVCIFFYFVAWRVARNKIRRKKSTSQSNSNYYYAQRALADT